jgi:hypothetical protein
MVYEYQRLEVKRVLEYAGYLKLVEGQGTLYVH